nr:hypothetical transcript [Hymenolepis microstoma]
MSNTRVQSYLQKLDFLSINDFPGAIQHQAVKMAVICPFSPIGPMPLENAAATWTPFTFQPPNIHFHSALTSNPLFNSYSVGQSDCDSD